MTGTFALAALWLALAVLATLLANHLHISMALAEICVGIAAGAAVEHFLGSAALGAGNHWLRFLATTGAVVLTFLAGTELEPAVLRAKWKEVTVLGLAGFLAPFLGGAAVAHYVLHWSVRAGLLAGVALSTTSMAVVYSVMPETGFNRTEFGKGILGACFVNDLGTVVALGLIFAPFTARTVVSLGVMVVALALLPILTRWLSRRYAYRRLLSAPSGCCWCCSDSGRSRSGRAAKPSCPRISPGCCSLGPRPRTITGFEGCGP